LHKAQKKAAAADPSSISVPQYSSSFQDSAGNKRPRAGVFARGGVGGRQSGQAGLTLMR